MAHDVYSRRKMILGQIIPFSGAHIPHDVYARRKMFLGEAPIIEVPVVRPALFCSNQTHNRDEQMWNLGPFVAPFMDYEDPDKAAKVWYEYARDMSRLGLLAEAINIRDVCSNSQTLDVHLNLLLENRDRRLNGKPRMALVNPETSGEWDNAVNAIESR